MLILLWLQCNADIFKLSINTLVCNVATVMQDFVQTAKLA